MEIQQTAPLKRVSLRQLCDIWRDAVGELNHVEGIFVVRQRNRVRFIASIAALGFVGVSSHSLANHAWGTYHWGRATNPFALQLGNNLSGSWPTYLTYAIEDWNTPENAALNSGDAASKLQPWTRGAVVRTVLVKGTAGGNCNAVAGTTQVCNKTYGANGWLGLATVWMNSSGHILQGTAKMNDTYFNSSVYSNANEKRHVMCQEVAHSFGLGHQSTDGSSQNSCMDYFSNTGTNAASTMSTRPNYHDFEQLWNIYAGHADASTTLKATPQTVALRSSVTDDPRTWGRLAHQSANGRHSEYIQNEPDGSIAVTEIIWTDETADVCRSCDHRTHRPGDVRP